MAESQNGHLEPGLAANDNSTDPLPSSACADADQLDRFSSLVRTIAQQRQGDEIGLLALLRQLEALHREVRDGLFQAALPQNRQALYALLRDIEAGGGWPYIPRMKLQGFLKKLPPADQEAITQILENSLSSGSQGNHHPQRLTAEPESLEW